MRLKGKTAIVTGGGSGFGAASALLFAAEGAKVALADQDAAGLEATAAKIRASGGESLSFVLDTTDKAKVDAAVAEVVGLDPVDVIPGPDAHHVDPMVHGGTDIPHDISVLADCPKDTAHEDLPLASGRDTLPAACLPFNRSTCRRR